MFRELYEIDYVILFFIVAGIICFGLPLLIQLNHLTKQKEVNQDG